MVFNSFSFILVYPFLFLLYYAIPAKRSFWRNVYLLLVSYLLYMQFCAAYALVLLSVTLITYLSARRIADYQKKHRNAGTLLSIGVCLTLLPLLTFKYYNFVNESCTHVLDLFHIHFALPGLNWAIPVGISFFTFQALGYLWDVYYGRIQAEKNFWHYALFISFFPSLVSGPINKASSLLPQIRQSRKSFDYEKAVRGMKLLLWGMFMKVVVADRVALYVDTVFPLYENYSGITCLVASLLYTVQIYADFAGYSLMAIGTGKTLGFDLAENFHRPYFSYSITDFWRRWHISLSTWLKDYIYIPLGGSRCSKFRNYANILITFLVSGIWHGANWTFVIWGIWHGVCQVIEKMLHQQQCPYGVIGKAVKIGVTFLLVNFAWIIFRMPTLADAFRMMCRISDTSSWGSLYFPEKSNTLFIIVSVGMLIIKDVTDEYFPTKYRLFDNDSSYVRWLSYTAIVLMILLTGVLDARQFIYANF